MVFTLPSQLARLALQNKKFIYGLLLQASAETLLEIAQDSRHLGAEIGFFSVLHTWNQKLSLHPHVHCVIPAGGLSLDHTRWVTSPNRFFLPLKVLSRVFRGKFVAGLKQAFQSGRLSFHIDAPDLARFPCLGVAYEALGAGGTAPAILNAANEVAVEAFLQRKIGFLDIARACEATMHRVPATPLSSLGDALGADREARAVARELLKLEQPQPLPA